MEVKKINQKYAALAERSFKTRIESYLLHKIREKESLGNVTIDEFLAYEITPDRIKEYEQDWQKDKCDEIGSTKVSDVDKLITDWKKEKKDTLIKDLLKDYKSYFKKHILTQGEFNLFYVEDDTQRKCAYCEISDQEISDMRERGTIKTKRGRGYSMEIDRINSNEEYKRENLLLACYWCNNAKTDEYTEDEFRDIIGKAIKKVWELRKSKVNN